MSHFAADPKRDFEAKGKSHLVCGSTIHLPLFQDTTNTFENQTKPKVTSRREPKFSGLHLLRVVENRATDPLTPNVPKNAPGSARESPKLPQKAPKESQKGEDRFEDLSARAPGGSKTPTMKTQKITEMAFQPKKVFLHLSVF